MSEYEKCDPADDHICDECELPCDKCGAPSGYYCKEGCESYDQK